MEIRLKKLELKRRDQKLNLISPRMYKTKIAEMMKESQILKEKEYQKSKRR